MLFDVENKFMKVICFCKIIGIFIVVSMVMFLFFLYIVLIMLLVLFYGFIVVVVFGMVMYLVWLLVFKSNKK